MRVTCLCTLVWLAATAYASAAPDLAASRAEPNLEKRSQLALANAAAALKSARTAYDHGEHAPVQASLAEVLESVELAQRSLHETGKDPRKSSKWFKRAEIETRALAKRLQEFQREMDFDDRHMVQKILPAIEQIHDALLLGVMEGKPK